jgi:hypothetical protein
MPIRSSVRAITTSEFVGWYPTRNGTAESKSWGEVSVVMREESTLVIGLLFAMALNCERRYVVD